MLQDLQSKCDGAYDSYVDKLVVSVSATGDMQCQANELIVYHLCEYILPRHGIFTGTCRLTGAWKLVRT